MFEENTSKLLSWIEQQNRGNGEYRSNANHPIWGVRNDHILPHTFHYYGIIISYLILYKKQKSAVVLERAKKAGDTLCALQKRSGQFRFDTFEFNNKKPTGLTLIHNALPSIALLELYRVVKEKKYFRAAKKNISWFYCRLWNGEYLSGCVNQDICAAEALASLYSLEKKEAYKQKAKRIADNLLKLQIKEGKLKGGFIRGFNERDLIIPWYDALTAVAYLNIAKLLGEEKYVAVAKQTTKFLRKNMTNEGLVHWYILKSGKWIQQSEPRLIAPAGIVLYLFSRMNFKHNISLAKHQQKEGSFPLSNWYKDERKYPNIGWNQFMLVFLCFRAEKQIKLKKISKKMLFPQEEGREERRPHNCRVYSLSQEGYIDVIKDHFTLKSHKLRGRYFHIPEINERNILLRFRMLGSRWRTVRPLNRRFLKVVIAPYWIIFPYIVYQGVKTRIRRLFF